MIEGCGDLLVDLRLDQVAAHPVGDVAARVDDGEEGLKERMVNLGIVLPVGRLNCLNEVRLEDGIHHQKRKNTVG